MDNKHRFGNSADAAAFLSGDDKVKDLVHNEVMRGRIVKMLLDMRLQKGVSQKRLAELMNCAPSKISRMEAGNDDSLKISDIKEYVSALNIGMAIVFEDHDLPLADRIKRDVFSIHAKLEQLIEIAKQVDGDEAIIDKIHQFYGEVLFNFVKRFEESHTKHCTVLSPENTLQASSQTLRHIQNCEKELCP
jgi:transcriptional regulator with XRE-family HTH domain